MSEEALLTVKQLGVQIVQQDSFTTPVDGVSFSLKRGEIMALVGESGCGKTMTALAINRLLPPRAAMLENSEIYLDSDPIHTLSENAMQNIRGLKVGMIFQDPSLALNPVMSIADQLKETIRKKDKKISKKTLHEKMENLLENVRIPDPRHCLKQYPHQLSGGMKQRIVIAMAIVNAPDLLIADEPTTNLDVTTQAQVLQLIHDLHKQYHMGILLITHDFGIVSEMANHVAVMLNGGIVESTTRDAFIQSPQHTYTQKLFAALPENLPQPSYQMDADENHEDEEEASEPACDLIVKDLKVAFPVTRGLLNRTVGYVKAVDGVSFVLKEGRTLALVGESGCGKTTTGKSIMRLIQEGQGEVLFQNQNLLTLSKRKLKSIRSEIQMVFQDPFGSMDPRFKIVDVIEEGLKALDIGTDHVERHDRVVKALEMVGLSEKYLNRFPHQLSGGQRQRVAIARAIAVGAKVMICDEPTSALDLSVQAQILTLLRSIQEDFAVSILFITHNISVVDYLAHDIAIMYLGRIVETGPAREVIADPKHPYTKALMAAVPSIHHDKLPLVIKGEPPSPRNPPKGCHFAPRCPKVHQRCLEAYPPSYPKEDGGTVACYLYERGQVSI